MKMLLITIISLLALYAYALEPPFSPVVIQELYQLSTLPSLINSSQLLAGLTPAELAAFLASASTSTTNNSQPNPIAKTFPNMTTGTINGSFVVLPLDYSVARAIIPRKYGILKHSIKAVLPFFPEDKYPVNKPHRTYKQRPILTRSNSSFSPLKSTTMSKPPASASLTSVYVTPPLPNPYPQITSPQPVLSIPLPIHRPPGRQLLHLLLHSHALHLFQPNRRGGKRGVRRRCDRGYFRSGA